MNAVAPKTSGWTRRRRHIEDLSDAEILALAIDSEEQASRVYSGFADDAEGRTTPTAHACSPTWRRGERSTAAA